MHAHTQVTLSLGDAAQLRRTDTLAGPDAFAGCAHVQLAFAGLRKCQRANCERLEDGAAFHRCGRCKQAYYCSRDCQARDWKDGLHKKHCGKLSKLVGYEFVSPPGSL